MYRSISLFITVLAPILLSCSAVADVTLSCRNELSGVSEAVTVLGASNADEARQIIRLDPQYGYYFEPSCIEHNTDRAGSDLQTGFNLPAPDPRLCKEACDQNSKCVAWTYVKPNTIQGDKPRCWIKGAVPGARNNRCCISGIK